MRVLVAGGAGFIGSHLCEALLKKGHTVTAADNLSLGRKENIAHLSANRRFMFHKADVLNLNAMRRIFKRGRFDMVFHLAANSDIARSHGEPRAEIDATFLTTYALLSHMRKHGVNRLFFASSSAIYGPVKGRISEDHGPIRPISHYGAAKLASEAFLSSFAENYGFDIWIARFPNIVGEHATHGVIFDFIRKLKKDPNELEILGDGEQTKPYLYVHDLVSAIMFICEKSRHKVNIYNIGVDSASKVTDIARFVAAEMGLKPRMRFTGGRSGWVGDVPKFSYDSRRLKRLGWSTKRSSNEAIQLAARMILRSESY